MYSTLGAQVVITNNGSGTANAGGIGLEVGGFITNLFPLPADQTVNDWFLGYEVQRPATLSLNDVIPIPVSGQSAPKSTGL